MSRSIRNRHNKYGCHIKLCGNGSNKKDKISANKKFRRRSRIDARLSLLAEDDLFTCHHIRNVSDVWSFNSDGLTYYINFLDEFKNNTKNIKITKYKRK